MKRQIELSIEQAKKRELVNLVGLRFDEAELESKLNEIFGTEIELHNEEYEEPYFDDCFSFSINEIDVYTLYYIETKDRKYYITEVALNKLTLQFVKNLHE